LERLAQAEASLKNKVDCDTYDADISQIREILAHLQNSSTQTASTTTTTVIKPAAPVGPQISTKDWNRIKELLEKFPLFEDAVNKLLKDMSGINLQQMKETLDSILKQLANFATIDQLKKLESAHQAILDKHTKDISKLFDMIRNLPKPEKVTNTIV